VQERIKIVGAEFATKSVDRQFQRDFPGRKKTHNNAPPRQIQEDGKCTG